METMTPEQRIDSMSCDERSLLLFLETQAVDRGGLVAARHMNKDDFEIAKRWTDEGFIRFSRIPTHLWKQVYDESRRHVVELSDVAWACAGIERMRRGKRTQNSTIVRASLQHFDSAVV